MGDFFQKLHIHSVFSILFTDEQTFEIYGVSNFQNQHLCGHGNPHDTNKDRHQKWFNNNLWDGIVGN